MPSSRDKASPQTAGPRNKKEARAWVRGHWATIIAMADMGGAADLENDHIDEVWSDECRRIARRLDPEEWS